MADKNSSCPKTLFPVLCSLCKTQFFVEICPTLDNKDTLCVRCCRKVEEKMAIQETALQEINSRYQKKLTKQKSETEDIKFLKDTSTPSKNYFLIDPPTSEVTVIRNNQRQKILWSEMTLKDIEEFAQRQHNILARLNLPKREIPEKTLAAEDMIPLQCSICEQPKYHPNTPKYLLKKHEDDVMACMLLKWTMSCSCPPIVESSPLIPPVFKAEKKKEEDNETGTITVRPTLTNVTRGFDVPLETQLEKQKQNLGQRDITEPYMSTKFDSKTVEELLTECSIDPVLPSFISDDKSLLIKENEKLDVESQISPSSVHSEFNTDFYLMDTPEIPSSVDSNEWTLLNRGSRKSSESETKVESPFISLDERKSTTDMIKEIKKEIGLYIKNNDLECSMIVPESYEKKDLTEYKDSSTSSEWSVLDFEMRKKKIEKSDEEITVLKTNDLQGTTEKDEAVYPTSVASETINMISSNKKKNVQFKVPVVLEPKNDRVSFQNIVCATSVETSETATTQRQEVGIGAIKKRFDLPRHANNSEQIEYIASKPEQFSRSPATIEISESQEFSYLDNKEETKKRTKSNLVKDDWTVIDQSSDQSNAILGSKNKLKQTEEFIHHHMKVIQDYLGEAFSDLIDTIRKDDQQLADSKTASVLSKSEEAKSQEQKLDDIKKSPKKSSTNNHDSSSVHKRRSNEKLKSSDNYSSKLEQDVNNENNRRKSGGVLEESHLNGSPLSSPLKAHKSPGKENINTDIMKIDRF